MPDQATRDRVLAALTAQIDTIIAAVMPTSRSNRTQQPAPSSYNGYAFQQFLEHWWPLNRNSRGMESIATKRAGYFQQQVSSGATPVMQTECLAHLHGGFTAFGIWTFKMPYGGHAGEQVYLLVLDGVVQVVLPPSKLEPIPVVQRRRTGKLRTSRKKPKTR